MPGLRLVMGSAASTVPAAPPADPAAFQDGCLLAFEVSRVARGFSQTSMDNGSGVLERFLTACGRPAWDMTREDVDRVVAWLRAR
jgi:integrase/recombinase XerD